MEKAHSDGRSPSIDAGIHQGKALLAELLAEARNNVPAAHQESKLGSVHMGHYNTQYEESMVFCDDDWVWWTPHFTPARGPKRPGFLAEGESSMLRSLCDLHFRSVLRMTSVTELSASDEPTEDQ